MYQLPFKKRNETPVKGFKKRKIVKGMQAINLFITTFFQRSCLHARLAEVKILRIFNR